MCDYHDLVKENQELRKQLITLSRCIRNIQDVAIEEDLSIELKVLLASVPVAYLHPPLYPQYQCCIRLFSLMQLFFRVVDQLCSCVPGNKNPAQWPGLLRL